MPCGWRGSQKFLIFFCGIFYLRNLINSLDLVLPLGGLAVLSIFPGTALSLQMVGVAQADAAAQRVQLLGRDALHCGLRAHWHEHWSSHRPVWQPQLPGSGPGAATLGHQSHDPRGRLQRSLAGGCRHLACINHVSCGTSWAAPCCLRSRGAR